MELPALGYGDKKIVQACEEGMDFINYASMAGAGTGFILAMWCTHKLRSLIASVLTSVALVWFWLATKGAVLRSSFFGFSTGMIAAVMTSYSASKRCKETTIKLSDAEWRQKSENNTSQYNTRQDSQHNSIQLHPPPSPQFSILSFVNPCLILLLSDGLTDGVTGILIISTLECRLGTQWASRWESGRKFEDRRALVCQADCPNQTLGYWTLRPFSTSQKSTNSTPTRTNKWRSPLHTHRTWTWKHWPAVCTWFDHHWTCSVNSIVVATTTCGTTTTNTPSRAKPSFPCK